MTLKSSDGWKNLNENNVVEDNTVGDVKHVIKVSANSGAAVSFPIIPSKLGNIPIEVHAQTTTSADGARRTLLVEVRHDASAMANHPLPTPFIHDSLHHRIKISNRRATQRCNVSAFFYEKICSLLARRRGSQQGSNFIAVIAVEGEQNAVDHCDNDGNLLPYSAIFILFTAHYNNYFDT